MIRTGLIRIALAAWLLAACGKDDAPPSDTPAPMNDAMITPVIEGGALEDRITIPMDPRDAAITEPTPILDLPLVIARPTEPLSTATIRVLAIDPTGAPLGDIGLSTGGPAVFTNAFGLAEVTAVYGRDFASLYGFGVSYTLSHARVPIRSDGTSHVVLMLALGATLRLDDMTEGGTVTSSEGASATFAGASFELPWGGPAKGPGAVSLAVLDTPSEAGAVPAGMQALIDGERLPIAGVLAFELRVAQGATELTLVEDVDVELNWPPAASALDASAQTLYHFDAKESAFVPRGSFTRDAVDPSRVAVVIDRPGTWLIGSHTAPVQCARADVQSGGAPLARAGLLVRAASGFSAARAEADEQGSGCALIAGAGPADAHALGELSGDRVWAKGAVMASDLPAACDEACPSSPLEGGPISTGCVRGTLSIPWHAGLNTSWLVTDGDAEPVYVSLPTNEPFCFDGKPGAQLALDVSSMTCTNDGVLVVTEPSVRGASCSDDDGCIDVGTIACCMAVESCTTTVDDDCDGVVDEGCTCGFNDCTASPTFDRCCTTTDACGQRSALTGECVGFEGFGIPIGCPSMVVPTVGGDTETATGCCRSNMECGLMWGSLGCIAAADVPRVWGPGTTLPSMACQ